MEMGLRDKVAVVTGASRGIGRAVALALAGEGVGVACVATSVESARGTAEACAELGVKAVPYGVDVSDFGAAQEFAGTVVQDLGPVDILVNNAGVTKDGVFLRIGEEDWDRVSRKELHRLVAVEELPEQIMAKALEKLGKVIDGRQMASQDGNWNRAQHLELIHPVSGMMASREELLGASKEQRAEEIQFWSRQAATARGGQGPQRN